MWFSFNYFLSLSALPQDALKIVLNCGGGHVCLYKPQENSMQMYTAASSWLEACWVLRKCTSKFPSFFPIAQKFAPFQTVFISRKSTVKTISIKSKGDFTNGHRKMPPLLGLRICNFINVYASVHTYPGTYPHLPRCQLSIWGNQKLELESKGLSIY